MTVFRQENLEEHYETGEDLGRASASTVLGPQDPCVKPNHFPKDNRIGSV